MLIRKHNTRPNQRREENDWYVDPLWCSKALFKAYKFRACIIYDPCCGQGNILKNALEVEYTVSGSDIKNRDWKAHNDCIRDFLDARDDWNSRRITTKADNLPYSFNLTTLFPGKSLDLWYKNHIEAVYCISGKGRLIDKDNKKSYNIKPGVIYILNGHEKHMLEVEEEMNVFCVFDPALSGNETHDDDGSYKIDDE